MPMKGNFQNPESPVLAGLDVIFLQDGNQIGYANEAGMDTDHMQEPIVVLGEHNPLDYKSLGYDGTVNTNSFLLLGEDVPGAFRVPGVQPDGFNNINFVGSFDLTMADVYSGTVLRTALRCRLGTESVASPNRGLLTAAYTWRTPAILPGIRTS